MSTPPRHARLCPRCDLWWRPQVESYVYGIQVVPGRDVCPHCLVPVNPHAERWVPRFREIKELVKEGLSFTKACRTLGLETNSVHHAWRRYRDDLPPCRHRREPGEIEPLAREAMRLMASGMSERAACRTVGISVRSVYNRKQAGLL